jgi:hypothetical protein
LQLFTSYYAIYDVFFLPSPFLAVFVLAFFFLCYSSLHCTAGVGWGANEVVKLKGLFYGVGIMLLDDVWAYSKKEKAVDC